jgi:glycosyltransferase involved in cell wall biosynthesis
MNSPRITIITPSYNQGQFIEETICSVLEQGYPNLEYIIIDGGSTDSSVEIIKKYEKHLTYWVSEKDKGQSDAINKGLIRMSGDIVNWLNSDDYYMPGALWHVAEVFSSRKFTAYCGRSRIFGYQQERESEGTNVYRESKAKTIGWARIDQPETFFSGEAVKAMKPLNGQLHYNMDKDWWVRYLCTFGIDGIYKDDKVLVNFRLHGNSKTVSLAENFQKETNNLYYSYALKTENQKYVSLLRDIFNATEIALDYFPILASAEEWDAVFNYFIYYQFLAAYAQNDYKKAEKIQRFIDKSLLTKTDYAALQKVNFRLHYLPQGIKKIWNKIRNL